MKKILAGLTIALLASLPSQASPVDFQGGVYDESSYEEMVFISGKPVKMVGEYTERVTERRDGAVYNYRLKLESEDGESSLDRQITLTSKGEKHEEIGQTTSVTELTKFKENIVIEGVSYDLEDYQFNKSDFLDNRPASDFYDGNIIGRKKYSINKDEGEVVIEMTGGNVGYENFWGKTETQMIDSHIVHRLGEEVWEGDFSHQVSDSLSKSLKYSKNNVNLSSVSGGYALITNRGVVSNYSYDLPEARGKESLRKDMLARVERMIIPKFRDVNGHWAEDSIKKLYSLKVFDDNSKIFAPNSPVNRKEFTKVLVRASDMRVEEENTRSRRKKKDDFEIPYSDVDKKDPYADYIVLGTKKGLIKGVEGNRFAPMDYLTRAEAVTIMMRSLGYEDKAPNPGYRTNYADDGKIPNWAKDSIYMASEIGLIRGDENNMVNPMDRLSRAEASQLIVKYLEFLEKGLQKDYRDNILKFN